MGKRTMTDMSVGTLLGIIGIIAFIASAVLWMNGVDVGTLLGIMGIVTSVSVGLFMWKLDKRRRSESDASHRTVIRTNISELHEMVTELMLEVRTLETGDERAVAEELDGLLVRNRSRMEAAMSEIRFRQAHVLEPPSQERKNVETVLSAVRWILDTYCRDDVPPDRRSNLWSGGHDALQRKAAIISKLNESL